MNPETINAGLDGVCAGDTGVCQVTSRGLRYRGYAIEDLVEHCCFEEVAHLLIYESLPTSAQLALFRERLASFRALPPEVRDMLRIIPTNIPLMDVLRTAVSACGHFDPVEGDAPDDLRREALWLMAVIASIITTRFRIVQRQLPLEPKPGLSHAAQLLYQIQGEVPTPEIEKLLDTILILYAEHEYSTSTFAARVIASAGSDQVSAVVGAIAALKGPLHGGAGGRALAVLRGFENAAQASRWVTGALAAGEKIKGFGHRVYKQGDPRAAVLEPRMRNLAEQKGLNHLLEIYDAIKAPPAAGHPPLYPNVDFPCGLTYHLIGLPLDLYAPFSAASRVAGWAAHYAEQHARNRLIRPVSRYVGPAERAVPPMGWR